MRISLKSTVLAGLLFAYSASLAIAGPADICQNAIPTGEAMGFVVDTTNATNGAPAPTCGVPAPDVWIAYTASCTGTATIETTAGPANDTIIEVWNSCGGSVLACDDDGGTGFLSLVELTASFGTTYYIRVSGWNGATGPIALDISCSAFTAENCSDGIDNDGDGLVDCADVANCGMDPACVIPSPDDCTNPFATGEGMGILVDTTSATPDMTPPVSCSFTSPDVWIAYTASCSGVATIETTTGPGDDTVLEVLSGCGGTIVACDDDGGTGFLSLVTFPVSAGTTYLVRVQGWDGDSGVIALNITCMAPLTNDDCGGADVLSGSGFGVFSTTVDTSNASTGSIPAPIIPCTDSGAFINDVWLSFTPDVTGVLTVTTCDPNGFDTDTLLYSGSCGALVEEACNGDAAFDAACQDFHSQTPAILATAGTSYLIRIGGFGGIDVGLNNVAVEMAPIPAETCNNGIDDDFDGSTDCFDSDCTADPACQICTTFLTQNIDPVTIDTAVAACAATANDQTDNSYFRSFDTGPLNCPIGLRVTGIEFGVFTSSSASGAGQPAALRLWHDSDGGTPDSGLSLVHEEILTIADGGSRLESITLSTPALFPTDAVLVVEVFIADSFFSASGDFIRLGTNGAGETEITYLTGEACALQFTPIPNGPVINLITDDEGAGQAGDSCSFALTVISGANAFDTTDFTNSPEPDGCPSISNLGGFNNDAWFVYTSLSRGQLLIDTCNPASYDTDLAAYSGGCGSLNLLGCDGDGGTDPVCQNFDSQLTIQVEEAETIYIRVGGFGTSSEGLGTLNLELFPEAPTLNEIRVDQLGADNDEFVEITGTTQSLDGFSILAIGDDAAGSSGVIESVTDLAGGVIDGSHFFVVAKSTFALGIADLTDDSLNLENSDNLTIYLVRGFVGSLGNDLDTDDDGVLDAEPWLELIDCVSFIETPGSGDQVYCATQAGPNGNFPPAQVERCPDDLGAFFVGEADATLFLDTPGAPNGCVHPPGNDECANPIAAQLGSNFIYTESASDSSDRFTQAGLPGCGPAMTKDIWYSFAATADGSIIINTCGLVDFDSNVEVYSGSCSNLILVGGSCDTPGCPGFSGTTESISVTAGTLYTIRIGGFAGDAGGSGQFEILFNPAGNECINALIANDGFNSFDTLPYTNSADDFDSTQCSGTFLGELVNDGWWTYTASIDGALTVSTSGLVTFDSDMVLYEGTCGALNQIACNGDAGSTDSEISGVPVLAGTTYTIRIGGWETGEAGSGQFFLETTPHSVAPTASFAVSPLEGIGSVEVILNDASDDGFDSAAIIDINWDDMTSDIGLAPGVTISHTYGPGVYNPTLSITNVVSTDTAIGPTIEVTEVGDCNRDGSVNLSDPLTLGNYLFLGFAPPDCLCACDTNGDGALNLADVIYSLLFLFSGAEAPIPPPAGTICGDC